MNNLTVKIDPLEEKIRILLLPADPEDSRNAILEIRAGTGGDEASLLQEISSGCTQSTLKKRLEA